VNGTEMGIVTELGMGMGKKIGPREWNGNGNSHRTGNGIGNRSTGMGWEWE